MTLHFWQMLELSIGILGLWDLISQCDMFLRGDSDRAGRTGL